MPARQRFILVPARPAARAAERLFRTLRLTLRRRGLKAEVLHIGATALRGMPTKGDLDIVVRVPAMMFPQAERCLTRMLARNLGSDRTDRFAAFKDDDATPPLGVQLVAIGSEHDDFHIALNRLRSDSLIRWRLRLLKWRHDGRSMQRYRRAKGTLLDDTVRSEAASRISHSELPSGLQTH